MSADSRAKSAPQLIVPTRLEFDATSAPKNCNDLSEFTFLLAHWVTDTALSVEADRRLVVRIRRSPKGGKLADVELVNANGASLAQDHKVFESKTECYKVLYETARMSARLMGAFEKPPAPEPFTCPVCTPPPAPIEPVRSPAPVSVPLLMAPSVPAFRPAAIAEPAMRRAFFGAGVFLGTGFTSEPALGTYGTLGFVPSPHSPRMRVEIGGAWTLQTLPELNAAGSLNLHIVPLFGSLCHARYVFRICSGMTTTFFQAKRQDLGPGNDDIRITLAGHLRMGAEFEIAGPFSMRLDAFMLLRFWERTFGSELAKLDAQGRVGGGAVAMGVWSFE